MKEFSHPSKREKGSRGKVRGRMSSVSPVERHQRVVLPDCQNCSSHKIIFEIILANNFLIHYYRIYYLFFQPGTRCIATKSLMKGGWIYRMPGVIVRDQEPFEKALKRFKKACEKAGIISDMKKHQHFEKPSERRKRKINAAKRKRMKMEKTFG